MSSVCNVILPSLAQSLDALDRILDKLAEHCGRTAVEEPIFLSARLYPDMFPFTRQIQIACDFAKGAAARLSGAEVPAWLDDETSVAALKARIEKTRAFIKGIPEAKFDGAETRTIKIRLGRNAPETEMTGATYIASVVLPNFYFHATTAYALLRHNGVQLGKSDFLNR